MTRGAAVVFAALIVGASASGSGSVRQSASARPVTIPFELAARHVIVQMTVNKSRPLSFVLDTGANTAIVSIIGGEFIKQFVLALDYQARMITLHDRETFTYAGRGEALPLDFTSSGHPVVKAAALQIGSFTIRKPFTMFAQDRAGAFADRRLAGNIGAQIASRFRTILDYGRRRIILEPETTITVVLTPRRLV